MDFAYIHNNVIVRQQAKQIEQQAKQLQSLTERHTRQINNLENQVIYANQYCEHLKIKLEEHLTCKICMSRHLMSVLELGSRN